MNIVEKIDDFIPGIYGLFYHHDIRIKYRILNILSGDEIRWLYIYSNDVIKKMKDCSFSETATKYNTEVFEKRINKIFRKE